MKLPAIALISLSSGVLLFLIGILYRINAIRPIYPSVFNFFLSSFLTGASVILGLAAIDWVIFQARFFKLGVEDLWLILIGGAVALNIELIKQYMTALQKLNFRLFYHEI